LVTALEFLPYKVDRLYQYWLLQTSLQCGEKWLICSEIKHSCLQFYTTTVQNNTILNLVSLYSLHQNTSQVSRLSQVKSVQQYAFNTGN
jgi:hypothetical protein